MGIAAVSTFQSAHAPSRCSSSLPGTGRLRGERTTKRVVSAGRGGTGRSLALTGRSAGGNTLIGVSTVTAVERQTEWLER